MRRAAAAVGVCAMLVARAPVSGAEPSIWYRASHPNARAEARLLRAMERMLDGEAQTEADPEVRMRFARAAVAMFDLMRQPSPEDPRLACAMARALVGANLGRAREAERLLEGAIGKLPEGTLLATAWHELARARAQRGDPAGARDAETRVLELAVDANERALAYYERAHAELRTGEVARAAVDFQRAAADAPTDLIELRARYGLGLALERSGDLAGAWAVLELVVEARLPLSHYPSDDPLDLPGAFAPPYELDYVRALALQARARHVTERGDRRAALEDAVRHWDAYLASAPPSEPWLMNARTLRERASGELRKLPADRHAHSKSSSPAGAEP
jgi:tetratricopeptide (TPR) repeat protein